MLDAVAAQPGAEPVDLTLVGVVVALGRLVRPAVADQIGRHDAHPPLHQHRDHPAVEEAPGRLAVHQQDQRTVGRARFHVVNAEALARAVAPGDDGVAGLVVEVGKAGEALVGRAEDFHGDVG